VIILLSGWFVNQLSITPTRVPQFRLGLVVVALSIVPQFLQKVPQGLLYSGLKYLESRSIELLANVAVWVGGLGLAYQTRNIFFVALWGLGVQIIILLLYYWAVARLGFFRWRVSRLTLHSMMNFSFYTFIESLSIAMFQQLDRILVAITLGPVAAGVYSVATSLGLRLSMLTGQATEVMIPYASLQNSTQNYSGLYRVFRDLLRLTSLLLGLLASLLILFIEEILALWISPDYARSYTLFFRIIIIGYSWLSLCRPGHQTLTGIGSVRLTSFVYLFTTFFMLLGLYTWAKGFGMLGAASANLVMVFMLVLNIYTYSKLAGSLSFSHLIVDQAWGLFIPGLFFSLTLFLTFSLFQKIFLMLILVFCALFNLWRDPFLKKHLSLKLRSVKFWN
jgi:O-antigen/teichoic acid export membrane protein